MWLPGAGRTSSRSRPAALRLPKRAQRCRGRQRPPSRGPARRGRPPRWPRGARAALQALRSRPGPRPRPSPRRCPRACACAPRRRRPRWRSRRSRPSRAPRRRRARRRPVRGPARSQRGRARRSWLAESRWAGGYACCGVSMPAAVALLLAVVVSMPAAVVSPYLPWFFFGQAARLGVRPSEWVGALPAVRPAGPSISLWGVEYACWPWCLLWPGRTLPPF